MRESWHAERAGKWESYWKDEAHDSCAPYLLTKCVEISADVQKELELDVVEEESIKIMLDGRHLVTLLSPFFPFLKNFANLLPDFSCARAFFKESGTFVQ